MFMLWVLNLFLVCYVDYIKLYMVNMVFYILILFFYIN